MDSDLFDALKADICADLRHALDNCYFSRNLDDLLENLEQLSGIAEGEMPSIQHTIEIENNKEEYEKS